MAREIRELEHVRITFPLHNSKAQVIVLNTGALIGPEAEAMMQALHSRSIGGFDHHFQEVANRGAEKFMQQTYVGYGHKSIGDCGSITLFIEGVSMLAAKAIQDSRLYNGQEASTRYIDFSKQTFIDPIDNPITAESLEELRRTYLSVREKLVPHLIRQYPRADGEDEKKYEKAINARSFDIARSLLPAGASTNLAWHSNIRQVGDHLMLLRHHPLQEVRVIAEALEAAVQQAYPNSFGQKYYEATEAYDFEIMSGCYYADPVPVFGLEHDGVNRLMLRRYEHLLQTRPEWTELPRKIDECGSLTYQFLLDFGSFRDIQRHRAVIQQMPLVTMTHGFEPWYLEQMPAATAAVVLKMLQLGKHALRRITPQQSQYYIPMGYRLPNQISGGLHALTYLAERRARNDVHPTLQTRAHQIADDLRERFREFGMVVHTEDGPGRFSMKRGSQDIVMVD
jgi:thymidylate synthase ThyX